MDYLARTVSATLIRFADAASSASTNTLQEIIIQRESAQLRPRRTSPKQITRFLLIKYNPRNRSSIIGRLMIMLSKETFARFAWMRHRTQFWTADTGFIISALEDGQKPRRNVLIARKQD